MNDLLNDIKTNWSSLSALKKVYIVFFTLLIVLLIIYIVNRASASEIALKQTDSQIRVEELEKTGVSFISDSSDEILSQFSKSSMAKRFEGIEENVDEKISGIEIVQKDILTKIDGISSGLEELQDRDRFLETQISSESAQRKAVYARISNPENRGEIEGVRSNHSTFEVDSIENEEVEYISAFDFLTLDEFDGQVQPSLSIENDEHKDVVVIETVEEIEKEIRSGKTLTGDKARTVAAGTIFKARLLAGVDTPTFSGAEDSAFPALAVIVGEALAPNGRSYDFSGCHILVGAYGSLSTERAYFRTQNLSCISDRDELLEASVNAFAAGVDGKAGLRGTVVTKDSSLIAKAIASSMWESIGAAVAPQQNIASQITTDNPFQLPDAQWTARNTIGKGLSASGAVITKRYLDIAKNIFPVIEIQAGRVIEFIVEKNFKITVGSDSDDSNEVDDE